MLKLNESSILSINPHIKNMHLSDVKAEESILNKIFPEQFLASMKEEELHNFNTLSEKEKKMHLMKIRRKGSKSTIISGADKVSPQLDKSQKNEVVYQPNILTITP